MKTKKLFKEKTIYIKNGDMLEEVKYKPIKKIIMKILIDKHEEEKVIEQDRIEIWVSEDKMFKINFNQFGELVINKQTFNDESSTIIIKPSVSNQINII